MSTEPLNPAKLAEWLGLLKGRCLTPDCIYDGRIVAERKWKWQCLSCLQIGAVSDDIPIGSGQHHQFPHDAPVPNFDSPAGFDVMFGAALRMGFGQIILFMTNISGNRSRIHA